MIIDRPVITTWEEITWPSDFVIPADAVNHRYRELIEKYGEPVYISSRGNPTLGEPFHVGKFLVEHPIKYRLGLGFYEYDQCTGVWEEITADKVKKVFSDDLLRYANESGYPELAGKRNDTLLRSLVAQAKGHCECEFESGWRWNLIHLRNGMLDIGQLQTRLLSFAPTYYSTNAVPFDYKPNATCPRFLQFLRDTVGEDDVSLVLRYIGMLLTARNFSQKILLLLGPGGTGKGTLVKIITYLIGEKNCEQLRTALLNQRFEIGRYLNKSLLIGADVPGDFLNLAGAQVLKSLTGGDLLSAELKGANGGNSLRGDFNVIVSSNQTLRVRLDGDHEAWRRRLLIVRCESPVERKNPNLAEEIIAEEASGIINAALAGWAALQQDYHANGDFDLTDQQKARVENLLLESDSVWAFHQSELIPTKGEDVTVEELYNEYDKFCGDQDWVAQPRRVFEKQSPQFMLEFFKVKKRNDIMRGDYPKRGYSGVALKSAGKWL